MIDWLNKLEELIPVFVNKDMSTYTADKTDKISVEKLNGRIEAYDTRLRPYIFTTTDGGGTYLGNGSLDDAKAALKYRFGNKLVTVKYHNLVKIIEK